MKVSIIGAGRNKNGIGAYTAKYFHKSGATVVSVLATTEKTAQKASSNLKQYGIESNPYTDFDKMIEIDKPDAVVIASPSLTHYEYLVKCVNSGLSIFCEKPFVWSESADVIEKTEDILNKAVQKKLTIAMNSQLPFSVEYYEKLCGKIEGANRFSMNMSPSLSGKEIIPEACPHPLSILYAVLGEGEMTDLKFEVREERRISIKFRYISKTNKCAVSIKLITRETQPREFSFGFNDKIVSRTIDLKNYDICFNYGKEKLKVTDPLELSVKDFIKAFEKKTEPLIGPKHILNNMVLLREIYGNYLAE